MNTNDKELREAAERLLRHVQLLKVLAHDEEHAADLALLAAHALRPLGNPDAVWADDARDGMRYLEMADLTGGETDALRPPPAQQEAVAWMIEDFRSPARFSTDPRTPGMAATRPDHVCTPLYTAPPAAPGVTPGYALVPVEPTPEMCREGARAVGYDIGALRVFAVYRAMLAAAASPSAPKSSK